MYLDIGAKLTLSYDWDKPAKSFPTKSIILRILPYLNFTPEIPDYLIGFNIMFPKLTPRKGIELVAWRKGTPSEVNIGLPQLNEELKESQGRMFLLFVVSATMARSGLPLRNPP